MVHFDDQAGVFEAYSDTEGSEWLGAYDTYTEARLAVEAAREAGYQRFEPSLNAQ